MIGSKRTEIEHGYLETKRESGAMRPLPGLAVCAALAIALLLVQAASTTAAPCATSAPTTVLQSDPQGDASLFNDITSVQASVDAHCNLTVVTGLRFASISSLDIGQFFMNIDGNAATGSNFSGIGHDIRVDIPGDVGTPTFSRWNGATYTSAGALQRVGEGFSAPLDTLGVPRGTVYVGIDASFCANAGGCDSALPFLVPVTSSAPSALPGSPLPSTPPATHPRPKVPVAGKATLLIGRAGRGFRVTSLRLSDLNPVTRVQLRCLRGCSIRKAFDVPEVVRDLGSYFRGVRLPAKSVIALRMTQWLGIGREIRWTLPGPHMVKTSCLVSPNGTLRSCKRTFPPSGITPR
jgi:hypothetical protein